MLAVCRAHGWRTEGYRLATTACSARTCEDVAEAAELDEDSIPMAVDGCGVLTFALSLERMAAMFTRLEETPAGKRVAEAMRAHPELIRGPGATDTVLMQAVPGAVAKGGAEGLLCGTLPDGTGFVLKARTAAIARSVRGAPRLGRLGARARRARRVAAHEQSRRTSRHDRCRLI